MGYYYFVLDLGFSHALFCPCLDSDLLLLVAYVFFSVLSRHCIYSNIICIRVHHSFVLLRNYYSLIMADCTSQDWTALLTVGLGHDSRGICRIGNIVAKKTLSNNRWEARVHVPFQSDDVLIRVSLCKCTACTLHTLSSHLNHHLRTFPNR